MTVSQPQKPSGGILALLAKYWLPIILAIAAIIFISMNRVKTQFTVLWVDINAPLWLMLTVVALLGFIVGWFVGRRRTPRA